MDSYHIVLLVLLGVVLVVAGLQAVRRARGNVKTRLISVSTTPVSRMRVEGNFAEGDMVNTAVGADIIVKGNTTKGHMHNTAGAGELEG